MLAKYFWTGILPTLAAGLRKFSGIFTVGIVGAGNKSAELSAAQGQPARTAFRA